MPQGEMVESEVTTEEVTVIPEVVTEGESMEGFWHVRGIFNKR